MRAAIIENGVVVNVIEVDALDALPGVTLIAAPTANIGDLWDGEEFTPAPPPSPTEAQIIKGYEDAVQQHMESVAQSWGYDNLLTAITYAGSSVSSKFKAEGQALLDWRALVWIKCHEVLAAVKAGDRPAPSYAELIAELPVPVVEYPAEPVT